MQQTPTTSLLNFDRNWRPRRIHQLLGQTGKDDFDEGGCKTSPVCRSLVSLDETFGRLFGLQSDIFLEGRNGKFFVGIQQIAFRHRATLLLVR
jgi:hypothetical protein